MFVSKYHTKNKIKYGNYFFPVIMCSYTISKGQHVCDQFSDKLCCTSSRNTVVYKDSQQSSLSLFMQFLYWIMYSLSLNELELDDQITSRLSCIRICVYCDCHTIFYLVHFNSLIPVLKQEFSISLKLQPYLGTEGVRTEMQEIQSCSTTELFGCLDTNDDFRS